MIQEKTSHSEHEKEEALKKIRFALNIITPDNFDSLKFEIHELARRSLENCLAVGNQIVSNAWDQKPYSRTYARLCKFLGEQNTLWLSGSKSESKKEANDFLRHVLGLVENVMELDRKLIPGAEENVTSYPANYEKYTKDLFHKRERMFGNVIFMGDLFLENLLNFQVIRGFTAICLRKYLKGLKEYKSAPQKDREQLYEDSLGYLLLLYDNIGEMIEKNEQKNSDQKKSKPEDAVEQFQKVFSAINSGSPSDIKSSDDEASLNDFFKVLDLVLKEGDLSKRMNCLALNLKDRRAKSWEEHLRKEEGPKTMKELHDEFEKEMEERRKNEERLAAGRQSDQRQIVEEGTQTNEA